MTETEQHAEKLRRYRFRSITTRGDHPGTWEEFAAGLEVDRDHWRDRAAKPYTLVTEQPRPETVPASAGAGHVDQGGEMLVQGTEARVCLDIAARQQLGIKKYPTTVEENPAELPAWLQHAYEECLDMSIYLKRAMEEIHSPNLLPTSPKLGT